MPASLVFQRPDAARWILLEFVLAQLRFVDFDSQARNRLDRGQIGRKNAEVLALKEKLFSLKGEQFELAIKTIKNMVETNQNQKEAKGNKPGLSAEEKKRQLLEMANSTENIPESSDLPIKPI